MYLIRVARPSITAAIWNKARRIGLPLLNPTTAHSPTHSPTGQPSHSARYLVPPQLTWHSTAHSEPLPLRPYLTFILPQSAAENPNSPRALHRTVPSHSRRRARCSLLDISFLQIDVCRHYCSVILPALQGRTQGTAPPGLPFRTRKHKATATQQRSSPLTADWNCSASAQWTR